MGGGGFAIVEDAINVFEVNLGSDTARLFLRLASGIEKYFRLSRT